MAEEITIKIENDHTEEIKKALDERIGAILTAWGEAAEGYAKEKCPVGTPESTGIKGYIGGTLKNSITYLVQESENAVYIGTNVKYGKYVELGTSRMEERSFLRPAITNHKEDYKRIADDILSG